MNKYEQFDNSMKKINDIENELNELKNSENIPLSKVMELRQEASFHYIKCNEILKDLKDNSKQSNE